MKLSTRSSLQIGLATLVSALSACHDHSWSVGEKTRARDAEVAVALGDTGRVSADALLPEDVPEIAQPQALRPCCAFGADFGVAVGQAPVPGVEIGNLIGPRDIGPHRYDNGYLSLKRADPRGIVDDENNGLLYTCRGGFIDLAHVRDNADNTLALAAAIARSLEIGGALETPRQGARSRVRLRPVSAEAIARYGRIELATALAQWIAYQISIWHEIATFYGYASLASWPEKISAFSPEDLYSNQIGVRIAAGLIRSRGARSDLEYGLGMDAWIQRALDRLEVVPLKDARTAMRAVDGIWWDSSKRIPDWTLVKRRQFDTGPFLHAWRLENASAGPNGRPRPLVRCDDAGPPLVLHVVDGFAGALFRDYATLELEIEDELVAAGFPLPRPRDRRINQEDFPAIIESARQATLALLGPGADAP